MRTRVLVATAAVAIVAVAPLARGGAEEWGRPGQMTMEYSGQVVNGSPTAASSRQFGNLRNVAGADASQVFTFYTEAVTTSVVENGPLRIVDRTGTTTVYLADVPGTFANPDSFRSGSPVQVSTLRQQVIVDTTSGLFTVVNINRITEASPFQTSAGGTTLGHVGGSFRTQLTGRLNTPGALPTGWFGGYAIGQ